MEKLTGTIVDVSSKVIRTLNHVAMLDLELLQSVVGSEGMQTAFFHLVSFWLRYWVSASPRSTSPKARAPPPLKATPPHELKHPHNETKQTQSDGDPNPEISTTDSSTTESSLEFAEALDVLLHELILLIGYVTVGNEKNRALLRFGRAPSILQLLVGGGLPVRYFVLPRLQEILFPTLIGACFRDEDNRCIVAEEMSLEFLSSFIKSKRKRQISSGTPPDSSKSSRDENGSAVLGGNQNDENDEDWCDYDDDGDGAQWPDLQLRAPFEMRFPVKWWDEAVRELEQVVS
ncbi:hypothetical protein HK102_013046 [Quaeritorhiza haematococci]|nr:hypothetical protein HK102_013046 [Quaeritorhiza haematococci]